MQTISHSTRDNPLIKETSDRLYKNRNTTGDIKFKIGDVEIPAHKCILAAFSPKYQRQFYGDFDDRNCNCIELKEPNVTASAFNEYLQFFYLNEVRLTHENIADVLFLAKESLVEEFYNECSKFISETLSIENVCQSYELAQLHDYDDLMSTCKRLIKTNLMEVFGSNGFLSSNRAIVLDIVQMAGKKCQAKSVFDACISWAKHFCTENDMDPNRNEDLRMALGDLLYEIRFDTMAFEEFIKYYRPYKGLFTEDEREEILQLIGKIPDFQPQWFKCTLSVRSESPTDDDGEECSTNMKMKMYNSIKCNRIYLKALSQTPYHGTYKTSFSTTIECELDAIFCGMLFDENGSDAIQSLFDDSQNQSVYVKIIEKDPLEDSRSFGHTIFNEEKALTFDNDQEACIKLPQPISISPLSTYEISMNFSDRIYFQTYAFQNDINIGHGIVRFYDNVGPVTGLGFLLKKSD